MAKAYWIAHVTVTDGERYKDYIAANAAALAKYNARFVVRGGDFVAPEGTSRERHVVIEFDSMQDARDCYHSPEYEAAMAIRLEVSSADLIIIGGYDGPQPG